MIVRIYKKSRYTREIIMEQLQQHLARFKQMKENLLITAADYKILQKSVVQKMQQIIRGAIPIASTDDESTSSSITTSANTTTTTTTTTATITNQQPVNTQETNTDTEEEAMVVKSSIFRERRCFASCYETRGYPVSSNS